MSDNIPNVTPPVAEKISHPTTIHNDTRPDDYFWLREKENPAVRAYLEAENTYTASVLKGTEQLQTDLYEEMLSHLQETDLSVPYRYGDFFYYTRTEEGKQYPYYCRKPAQPVDGAEPAEEITLDLNAMAEGEKFLALGQYKISDDGNLLAYTTDVTGFRIYNLKIKNLATGEHLPDFIEKVTGGLEWSSDGKTLFYGTEDEAKRPYRIFRHAVGEKDGSNDSLIFEELDALYRTYVMRTRDKAYTLFYFGSATSTEFHALRSDDSTGTAFCIRPRETEHEYYVDHRDGTFYIRTNKDAPNYRLIATPADAPDFATAKEILPHQATVTLDDHDCFADHLVITLREGGLPRLRVRDFESGDSHDVTFPEPTYTVAGDANREFDTTVFRFRYASLITPSSVFDYNMTTRERVLLKETPVPNYDRTQYISEYLHAPAEDGTLIPISLIYKKGPAEDGDAPLMLYGYGSYGLSMPAGFNANRLCLLDRGAIYAIAHIRGGGEFGKPWHDAGKMQKKRTTFTDFIACGEFLVKEKYTSPKKMAMAGGSAGGLLMGAVVNMRPDLFCAVLSYVPFVDVLNTMLDATLPLTIGEYLEWGNPNVAEEYAYMKTYCPYTNLVAKPYPATLIKTSLNDSQVMYWEPAKYVAKLRTLKQGDAPLLLHTNLDAGHGGASGRYDALREQAMDYAFLLKQWGL